MKTKCLFLIGIILFLSLPFPSIRANEVFSDVASDYPYFEAIQTLAQNKVIEGYSDHTFQPHKPVNRAEALKIILIGSDIFVPEIQPTEIFPDVLVGVWYAKYAAKAKNLNVIQGDPGTGFFRPGDTINLAEILKILIETNKIQVEPPARAPFKDVPADAWFAPYFEYARLVQLLPGSGEKEVQPALPITRGLMAELLYRLQKKPKAVEGGKASYYGGKFHGRTTASGEVFDASGFTAAHRAYSFGTWLKVTNQDNGKSVTVRVNDRGPYGDAQRVIDLSKAAFEAIAPLSRGVISVTIERADGPSLGAAASTLSASSLLSTQKETCPERALLTFLPSTTFQNLELTSDLPSHGVMDEVILITGKALRPSEKVTLFITDEAGEQTAFSASVKEDFNFSLPFSLAKRGDYQIGMILGESGESRVHPFHVLSYACLEEKENESLPVPPSLSASIKGGKTRLEWEPRDYNLFQLSFLQENHFRRLLLRDTSFYEPNPEDFTDFNEGAIAVHLRGAHFSHKSVLQAEAIQWSKPLLKSFSAVTHYDLILNPQELTLLSFPPQEGNRGDFIRLNLKTKTSLRQEAAFILPDGIVERVKLQSQTSPAIKNQHDLDVFPPLSELTLKYRLRLDGLHMIEINNAEGLAALNMPIYPGDTLPLIPSLSERRPRKPVANTQSPEAMKTDFLNRINQDRERYDRPLLSLDASLSALAQARSDDMVAQNYFSHWNAEGLSANELRKNHGISQLVAENLAKDVDAKFAQFGLMRSAIHRQNILDPQWSRVGLGIARASDNTFIFVQLFSEEPLDLTDPLSLRQEILRALNQKRSTPFTLQDSLSSIAQRWSDQMVAQNFFDFENSNGESLSDLVQATGRSLRTGTYLVGNTSFQGAIDQLLANASLQNTAWKTLGLGIAQDHVGVIKMTLIYSE